jgi:hypothetical protein
MLPLSEALESAVRMKEPLAPVVLMERLFAEMFEAE